jgi:hypothetical protein
MARSKFMGTLGLLLLAVALTLGCSEAEPQSESTAVDHQVLTFPVTITLSAPGGVSPTAPAVGASNSVSLGARAEVVSGLTVAMGSGGLRTQPDALLNETWSRGVAQLGDRVRVRGTLHAVTRSDSVGAPPTVTSWDRNPAFDPASKLSWQVSYPSGAANPVTLNAGQAATLEPGKYGVVTLNSQSSLTLKSGVYYLTSLSIQADSVVIRIDQSQGPTTLYTTDALTLRGSIVALSGTEDPNLLVAHLGTAPVTVETRYNAALIAPSATVTLRSVAGIHTGYFYAKDMALDAGARVQYRAPLGLIRTAVTTGPKCRALLPGTVPESDVHLYCPGGCAVRADTDRDGVEDCVDACPYDPLKVTVGKCPCGTPDTDTDGDQVPNCFDDCDLDPNATSPGQCGCLSSDPDMPERKPTGTPCNDTSNPVTGTPTCNGAGVCGTRTPPAVGCRVVQHDRSAYWVCPGPVTQSAAVAACRSRGLPLVQIDGFTENQVLRRLLTSPAWIGANSITASGVWRWTSPTGNNGPQFWQGTAVGAQRNSLFSSWNAGAPGNQRCAIIQPSDGRWVDVDCSQARGYVCEFTTPLAPGRRTPIPGLPAQPPAEQGACIAPTDAGLPLDEGDAGFAQLEREVADSIERGIHQGAAASPPDAGVDTCLDDFAANAIGDLSENAGCAFTPVATPDFNCFDNADCAPFGSNLVCRQIKKDATCRTENGVLCAGESRCGTLACPAREEPRRCDQREICNPDQEFFIRDPDTDSNLTPTEFEARHLFGGTLPDVASAGAYSDPPTRGATLARDHAWCFMDPQEPIPDAHQPETGKQGKAGGSSRIKFSFDPDLVFDANVNPLSLGESDLKVHAAASLVTRVALDDFIGQDFDREVLSAVADLQAERCTIRNDATRFEIFELDFVDFLDVPKFNTSDPDYSRLGGRDWFIPSQNCNRAVGDFVEAANRAKKAFRDVQQMITQYEVAKSGLTNLRDLCSSVMRLVEQTGAELPYFPGGYACDQNEPAYVTIDRFLKYYQAPGSGVISQLRDGLQRLSDATQFLRDGFTKRIPFGPQPRAESKTIIQAQFQIGPVPVLLEIDAFYSYGAAGYFEINFHFPFDPFSQELVQRQNIADVRAGVMPFAAAGLSAFVGAGRRLGPISASVGIEGSVTLGDIKAPIFGGAGIGMETQFDDRTQETELNPLAQLTMQAVGLDNLTHFGRPKSAKFFVWYNYGAALELRDILSGEIKGRVRIKFAFFSRTWRKRIVKFNGFSRTFHLVSGKDGVDPDDGTQTQAVDYPNKDGTRASASTLVVEGTTDVGMSEAQAPLLVLQPVEPLENPPPAEEGVPFEMGAVQDIFYDNLCCAKLGEDIPLDQDQCVLPGERPRRGGAAPCCAGLRCQEQGPSRGTRCVVDSACQPNGGFCTQAADCCDGAAVCDGTTGRCTVPTVCPGTGESCDQVAENCCIVPGVDTWCGESGFCEQCVLTDQGASCTQDSDCCDFVPGQQDTVRCASNDIGGFECTFVNQ